MRGTRLAFVVALVCFVLSSNARSQNMSDALEQTQTTLRDRQQRANAVHQNADATALDKNIQSMTGSPATSDRIYDLSADILADLVNRAQGDPEKLQELVHEAQKNPEAFANSLSPAQREQIHSIAGEIESQKKGQP
jgi:hypothetical protein